MTINFIVDNFDIGKIIEKTANINKKVREEILLG
jgi:hypothetical protein